mmetsp:Transcript_14554/g.22165  ORF Transcript_14554/g.22165 Transcript_14554/m.22165 type:complete len:178 (-) Transcript_14554:1200-1733(-)
MKLQQPIFAFFFSMALLPPYLCFSAVSQTRRPFSVISRAHATATSTTTRLSMARRDANMTPEEREVAVEKATKAMTSFSNSYIAKTKTRLCQDKSVPAVVIKGLAEHKVSLGAPLCPCRFYEDKEKEVREGYWNCPCVPMRERKECHCMLFLAEDNPFAGTETKITLDEVKELSSQA